MACRGLRCRKAVKKPAIFEMHSNAIAIRTPVIAPRGCKCLPRHLHLPRFLHQQSGIISRKPRHPIKPRIRPKGIRITRIRPKGIRITRIRPKGIRITRIRPACPACLVNFPRNLPVADETAQRDHNRPALSAPLRAPCPAP